MSERIATLVYNIQEIDPGRPPGSLQKFLTTTKIAEPAGVCVSLKSIEEWIGVPRGLRFVDPSEAKPLGRARAFHYRDGLLLGDALFEVSEWRDVLRQLFFMVRILFAIQNGYPLNKVIWPAGLLAIEPRIEHEIAGFCMRALTWADIEDDPGLRRMALASAFRSDLSETGLYCVDAGRVAAPRFANIAERFLREESSIEDHRIREPLQKLVTHTPELLHFAA
jgi:hypothetical protein